MKKKVSKYKPVKQAPKPETINPGNDIFRTIGLTIILFIFLFSVFKHISYPLFWADEGMTVVGPQRVLEFGYPKVHDDKNVFYDLKHSDPNLGIDPETDAYIGGAGWGQYYFATIGVALAQNYENIYTKTGIIRSTFSIMALLGLFLFIYLLSKLFVLRSSKLNLAIAFIVLTIVSVSFILHIKEARYYAPALFCILSIAGIYISYRFLNKYKWYFVVGTMAVLLWLLFVTFAPAFFIILVVLGISELTIIVSELIVKQQINMIFQKSKGVIIGAVVALIAVIPFMLYFKTFEISTAMAEYNNFSFEVYKKNLTVVVRYFSQFELLWLFLCFKLLLIIGLKKIDKKAPVFKSSLFLTFLMVVFALLIARIPNFVYTRYIIYLQPVMTAVILLDFSMVWQCYPKKYSINKLLPAAMFLIFLSLNITSNKEHLSGRITELSEQYKGPLDYTIPFIQEKYKNTDTLVIAANYEETSYMYYLNSKVIVGFVGNNLDEDKKADPDIICYRSSWGRLADVFNGYFNKSRYLTHAFEVYDNPLNNIPELNFMPAYCHKYKTKMADSNKNTAKVYFKPTNK